MHGVCFRTAEQRALCFLDVMFFFFLIGCKVHDKKMCFWDAWPSKRDVTKGGDVTWVCVCVCVLAVGDGVLWRRLGDGPDQEHQGQLAEGGVDGVHLPGDSQGKRSKPQTSY